MKTFQLYGADAALVSELVLYPALLFAGSTILVLSPSKADQALLRDAVTVACEALPFKLDFTVKNQSRLSFSNGSTVYFQDATRFAGKGLTLSMLVICNCDAVKNLDAVIAAHQESLNRGGRLVLNTRKMVNPSDQKLRSLTETISALSANNP